MVTRIAAVLSLLVFMICLLVGGLDADNSFSTTVERALTAMMVSLVIGLVLGAMARAMLEENLKSQEEKLKKDYTTPTPDDR
jgi:NhaP-type Na+/H+ or K+/H+ antiporter